MVTFLLSILESVLINENIIFQKRNDVTTSHVKWLTSFVINLQPLGQFLDKVAEDIKVARVASYCIGNKY